MKKPSKTENSLAKKPPVEPIGTKAESASAPSTQVGFRRVECLHQLILANLKLGHYTKAKVRVGWGGGRT